MKKNILFIISAVLVLKSVNLNSQDNRIITQSFNSQNEYLDIVTLAVTNKPVEYLKTNEIIAKPGYSEDYFWTGIWTQAYGTIYIYNDKGVLIEELKTIGNTTDSTQKKIWIYDEYDQIYEHAIYAWNDGWEISDGYKNLNTYDLEGRKIESIYQWYSNGDWLNNAKNEIAYNIDGEQSQIVTYEWENDDWVPSYKTTDFIWHNWDKLQVESYTYLEWVANWVETTRYSFTYTGDNYIKISEVFEDDIWKFHQRKIYTISNMEEITTYEVFENDEWVYNIKVSITYSEFGDRTEFKIESWENNSWEIESHSKYILTYNEINELIEKIKQVWFDVNMTWLNLERNIYSDYQYFELGISELEEDIDFRLYPNPVNEIMNIDLSDISTKEYNVHVFNILGQEVYNDQFGMNNIKVDIQGLPDGLYVVQIELDGNKVISKKFIKQ